LDLGIVGLPQSGKSSLLALLAGGAVRGDVAVAKVPDRRLDVLAALFHPRKVTPATIRLTELPGLVPGRLEKGQRNAFFEGVRRTDALLQVVRAFADPSVPVPSGGLDPLRDARVIEEEMLLADLEQVEALVARLEKNRARGRQEELQLEALRRCAAALGDLRPLRQAGLAPEDVRLLSGFGLLTARGVLLAVNEDEEALRAGAGHPELEAWAAAQGIVVVPFSARVEAEIAALPPGERAEFMAAYGLTTTGTERLAAAAYAALGLVSFLTAGEDEVRAWPVPAGTPARQAAGKIHSDIERGFIRAEVASFADLEAAGSWKALRERGLVRLEGRDYPVRDGDIIEFRFHV
jgi:GTP-binding protein YchF